MHERRLFPASIVDEITYCVDRAYTNLSLIYSWILMLEGEVSTEASQKALDEALNYYPKCKCILVNNYPSYKRWFRHCWECTNLTGKDILEEIEYPGSAFNSEEAVNYYTNNHAHFSIDPSSQVPLKVLLARQPKRAFLFFIFHHAVADGLGSFFFIQKFIQCYEEIFYQRAKETHDETKFNVISSPEIRFRWSHFSPRLLRPYLRHFSLFLKEPSLSLFPHETVGISGEFIATVRQIPPRRLEAIRSTSKKYQATINDYLLATMFQTIKKWSQKWTAQSDRIYITVPMNLRSPEDRTLSNILSGATISFKPELIGDKEEMLHLIREEMTMVMNNNIPRTLINFSSFLKPIPIPLRIFMLKHSIPGFSPTIVLSNMGVLSPNPSHKDEEGFHYMGPARICNIHGIAAVGGWPMLLIFTYNNRVIFNMSSLSSYFPPETAGRFIDSFLGEIIG